MKRKFRTKAIPYYVAIIFFFTIALGFLVNAEFATNAPAFPPAVVFILLGSIVVFILFNRYHSLELKNDCIIGRDLFGRKANTIYYTEIGYISTSHYRKDLKTPSAPIVVGQGFHKDLVIHLKNGEIVTIESAIIDEIDELADALNYYIEKELE